MWKREKKAQMKSCSTTQQQRIGYVNFDKANPFQTRSLVFSTTRNEDAITQISLATENIIIRTSYVSVQHPWRQKWNPELMYFSLVKLFKWTFSDYAIHMLCKFYTCKNCLLLNDLSLDMGFIISRETYCLWYFHEMRSIEWKYQRQYVSREIINPMSNWTHIQ